MRSADRLEARRLRSERGLSIREISQAVGASRGSVSVWVRDIELTTEQKDQLTERQRRNGGWPSSGRLLGAEANRRKARLQRVKYQEEGRQRARANDPLHVMGYMLYWGEGSKSRNTVRITNSDPALLTTFMKFLRQNFEVSDDDFQVRIVFYEQNGLGLTQQETEDYWLHALRLRRENLRPASTDKRTRSSKGRFTALPYGRCALHLCRVDVVQHIYGAIQEYVGIDNTSWIDLPNS